MEKMAKKKNKNKKKKLGRGEKKGSLFKVAVGIFNQRPKALNAK